MARSFTDIVGGGDRASAAGSATAAVGELGKAAEDVGKLFKGSLGKTLDALVKQLEQNAKDIDRNRKRGIGSEREHRRALEAANAALNRVNKTAEELAENNIVGAKAAEKINKEAKLSLKLAKAENDLTKKRLRGENALLASVKASIKQRVQAARFELQPGRINTGKSAVVGGAGSAMQAMADKLPGAGGLGPSGFGGGALSTLSGMGPWGLVAGAIAKAGTAIIGAQRDAVIAASRRIISYGTETGSVDSDIVQWQEAFKAAGTAAVSYNLDLEAVKSSTIEIATQTGATAAEMQKAIPEIARMAFVSGRGIEDLSQQLVARANQTGKGIGAVTEELTYTTEMAFALKKTLGGKVQLDVNDFAREVQELADSMEALDVDQKTLSKRFASGLVVANKLGLSYTRGAKAAKQLAMAMTANYDQGFATLEVEEDLAALAASAEPEKASQAKEIQEMLRTGFITQDKAAKMLNDLGLDTSAEMFDARMARVTQAMARGEPLALIEARTGELSPDTVALLKRITSIQEDTGLRFEDAVGRLSPEEQKKLRESQEDLAKKQIDPAKAANVLLDKMLYALSETIPSALSRLIELITSLGKLMGILADPMDMARVTGSGLKEMFFGGESDSKLTRQSLAHTIGAKAGAGVAAGMSPEETIQLLASRQDILGQMRSISDAQKKEVIDVLGKEAGQRVVDTIMANKAKREVEASKNLVGTVTRSGTNAAGGGKLNIEAYDATAGKQAQKAANTQTAQANSHEPQKAAN